jgi:hypothetical protein
MARPHGGYSRFQIPASNPRQIRPAHARKIAAAVALDIARKIQRDEDDRQAIKASGIKLKSDEPTPREIQKARQKMNRRGFIARLNL